MASLRGALAGSGRLAARVDDHNELVGRASSTRGGRLSALKRVAAGVDQPLMAAIGPVRTRLRLLLAGERGFVLPTALLAMTIAFSLATAAVVFSVDAQRGTARDHSAKEAVAAADSGANIALERLNRFEGKLSTLNPCIGPAGESLSETSLGSGWCPATSPESVGGATFYYMTSTYNAAGEVKVVAVGTANGVSRRVKVNLASPNRKPVFLEEKMIGEGGIELKGGDILDTSLGTNGSVVETSENGKSAEICGNIRKGIGGSAPTPSPSPPCPEKGTVTEGNKTLPPVVPPPTLATENSDYRLVTCTSPLVPTGCESDTYQGKTRTASSPWEPAKTGTTEGIINIPKNATLTLGGHDYFVCGLFIEGTLYMVGGSEVRIFFDTPEHCGLSAGATQIKVGGSGSIKSTAFESSACQTNSSECKVPGLYVMGSPTVPTTVDLGGNVGSTNELMLYAPYSNVTIHGNVTWTGMFAGKTMTISGNATIKSDARIPLPEESYAALFQRTRYVQCGAAGALPDANC